MADVKIPSAAELAIPVNLRDCDATDPCDYDNICRIHKLKWWLRLLLTEHQAQEEYMKWANTNREVEIGNPYDAVLEAHAAVERALGKE